MKIGVDCHVFDGKFQGSRRYLEGIYKAVLNADRQNEWLFFQGKGNIPPEGWPSSSRWDEYGTYSRVARLGWKAYQQAARNKLDYMHYTYVAPLVSPCPIAVTIHDILFETYPQFFAPYTKYILGNMIYLTARRADIVYTISEFTKQQLIEIYKIPAEKILLTPCGVDPQIFNPLGAENSREKIYHSYGLKDFILTTGRLEPRKNHLALIKAYKNIKAKRRKLPKLVFIGSKDFGYDEIIRSIKDTGLTDDVVILHGISDSELADFYRSAIVMAYPSFAEGFGIPPLEAMACGCPVISSDRTALREVIGEAGWLVNPYDWTTIECALEDCLESPSRCVKYRQLGIRQASKFTWESSAETLIQGFRTLAMQ